MNFNKSSVAFIFYEKFMINHIINIMHVRLILDSGFYYFPLK